MTRIKLCGMTREDDVRAACALDIDALGFVLWPGSPRHVPIERVAPLLRLLPKAVLPVAVCVAPGAEEIRNAADAGFRVIQIHGVKDGVDATWPSHVLERWIAGSVDDGFDAWPSDVTIVLDAHDPVRHGGTGRTIDWPRAAAIAATRRVILAGGLTASNVADALRQVRPYGVDVASGIEDRPGVKNLAAMQAFVAAVREAEQ